LGELEFVFLMDVPSELREDWGLAGRCVVWFAKKPAYSAIVIIGGLDHPPVGSGNVAIMPKRNSGEALSVRQFQ
jgi:hypothetical protein